MIVRRILLNVTLILTLIAFSSIEFTFAAPSTQEIKGVQAKLKQLLDNIDAFWLDRIVDTQNGGYHLNHDKSGADRGPEVKGIVSQARCLWYFSHLLNHGYGDDRHRAAADHGFAFIRDHMHDQAHGGFYEQIGANGKTVAVDRKHLYGQAFVLYALSEYWKATAKSEAKALANELFLTFEEKAYDRTYGGYRESFNRDWSIPDDDETILMSVPSSYKLMNTHLHIMEAFTNYYPLDKSRLMRDRLHEMVAIQSNTVVRKPIGACTDKYFQNWLPIDRPEFNRVSYGHDIENVWLLIDANNALAMPNGPYLDLYKTLFDYSLQYGYDHANGGFYDSGRFNQPATSKRKVWWVEAEGIVSALEMYAMTGEERYWKVFIDTVNWIDKHMVDWENGGWFSAVSEDGDITGGKAHLWKTPYHNGRALVRCLKTLQALSKR